MTSEDAFNDKPVAEIDENAVAMALDSDHVFERSSLPPEQVLPSPSSTDAFPDEPEPSPEPLPEPQSSYGLSDPASLAAAGSGELKEAQLGPAHSDELAQAALSSSHEEAPSTESEVALVQASPEGLVLQPHLAHLAQVGLTHADTWGEQIKPRIDTLHEQIDEVNVRLDHLTTPKRKYP